MSIPRIHLVELEDLPWWPAVVRDLSTDYLHFMETKLGLHRPAVPILADALRTTGMSRVIDLCSGGGGGMPALREALAAEGIEVDVTLTDRFPNVEAFRRATADSDGHVGFVAESVDARAVPAELRGFRTLFNSFHHFRAADATAILRNAAAAGQPIGVFELSNRGLGTLIPMIFLTPLIVALATPFIRPFRWSRLFWTYLVPLVILTCWWDGIVSQARAYTTGELEQMGKAAAEDYCWRAGTERVGSVPACLTYLIGFPEST